MDELGEYPPPPRRALLYMPGNDERKVRFVVFACRWVVFAGRQCPSLG